MYSHYHIIMRERALLNYMTQEEKTSEIDKENEVSLTEKVLKFLFKYMSYPINPYLGGN